jgi:biopolymer transport protein ExbB/TolQ
MPFQHLLHDPVLIVLLLASLTSWALIIDRVLVLRRVRRADAAFKRGEEAHGSPLAHLYMRCAATRG